MLQVVAYPVGGRWLGGSCTRTWSSLPITAATDTATYILTNLLTYYLLLTTAAHRRAGDGDVHAARRAHQRQLARAHRGARGRGQRATPLTRPLSASLVHGNTLVLP